MKTKAFTLIELLVVITIIVVLLALLTPALDKAVYQSELAICGANLRGIATGVTTYAVDFKRRYPHRGELETLGADARPQIFRSPVTPVTNDDRHVVRDRIPLKLYVDPLAGKVVLDPEQTQPDTYVYSSYSLWYSWQYTGESSGMRRVGDLVSLGTDNFSVLASDMDSIAKGGLGGEGTWAHNSHPDSANVLTNVRWQDELALLRYTCAWWVTLDGRNNRGLVDRNFAFDDTSVSRLAEVKVNLGAQRDDRVVQVPLRQGKNPGSFEYLPLR